MKIKPDQTEIKPIKPVSIPTSPPNEPILKIAMVERIVMTDGI
jgi:hypothetical protein